MGITRSTDDSDTCYRVLKRETTYGCSNQGSLPRSGHSWETPCSTVRQDFNREEGKQAFQGGRRILWFQDQQIGRWGLSDRALLERSSQSTSKLSTRNSYSFLLQPDYIRRRKRKFNNIFKWWEEVQQGEVKRSLKSENLVLRPGFANEGLGWPQQVT